MNRPEQHDDVEPVIQALDQWQAELDPVQRARLSARSDRARSLGWLGPALAAGVLLALGIGLWPQPAMPPSASPTAGQLAAGDTLNSDEALMDEDAEYLLWLASDDAA